MFWTCLALSVPRVTTVYELDGDPASVMAELTVRTESGAMVIDQSFDVTSVALTVWRPR